MRSLKGVAEYLNVSLFHLTTLKVFQTAQDFHEFKAFQLFKPLRPFVHVSKTVYPDSVPTPTFLW